MSKTGAALLLLLPLAACNNDSFQNGEIQAALHSGPAGSFAVLAGTAVTCTDSTVAGDVGVSPGTAITQTNCAISGTTHAADSTAAAGMTSFLSAYEALDLEACDEVLTGTLAGVTLAPGTYCFDAAATLTGQLTLDGPADGVWLFKIGTSGTGALTGTNFSVVMAGGGVGCNVTWLVAEAATLTTSNFLGNVLAGAAITITGGSFSGDALAQAAVTMTGAAIQGCEPGTLPPPPAKKKCNQGVGNGPEACDPGNSNQGNPANSNDELGGTPGNPGRKGGKK
jgi:hypothetical protein